MPHRKRVADLYQGLEERLQLKLCAGEAGLEQTLLDQNLDSDRDIVAGPLSYIHPNRVQVIGQAESAYLNDQDIDRSRALRKLFDPYTRAVVFVDGVKPEGDILKAAEASGCPVFCTALADKEVLDHLQHYAALYLSKDTSLHGVFLEVLGMGVLITGDPAVGKSELALDLISRGSRLVADDVTEFKRIAPDIISGQSPALLCGFLEVRGLGILNIGSMFGDSAIKHSKYLRLIVHLKVMDGQALNEMERLAPQQAMRSVLDVDIPLVTIPVAPGRNLAILVEAAVRNHLLKLKGYDATEMFMQQQQKAVLDNN
jgi:HPr kinase/phosphorylase